MSAFFAFGEKPDPARQQADSSGSSGVFSFAKNAGLSGVFASKNARSGGVFSFAKNAKLSAFFARQKNPFPLAPLLLILAGLLLSQIFLTAAAFLLLLRHLPLPRLVSDSFVFRALATVALIFAIWNSLALVFYFLHLSANFTAFNVLLLAAGFGAQKRWPRADFKFRSGLTLAQGLPAALVAIFYGASVFKASGRFDFTNFQLLQSISKAEDDSGNHLLVFAKFLTTGNQGYFPDSYTGGAEWTTSLLANSVLSHAPSLSAMWAVYFYIAFKLLLLVFSTAALTCFLYYAAKRFRGVAAIGARAASSALPEGIQATSKTAASSALSKAAASSGWASSAISLALAVFLISPMYRNGFYSFVPILGFVLLAGALFLAADFAPRSDSARSDLTRATVGAFALSAAVSTTWFIMAFPLGFAGLFLAIAASRRQTGQAARGGRARVQIWVAFAAAALVLSLVIALFLTFPESPSAADALQIGGGFPALPRAFVLVAAGLAGAFLVYNWFGLKRKNPFIIFAAVHLGFLAALFAYFTLKAGGLSYYYFKIETGCLILLVPCAVLLLWQFFAKSLPAMGVSLAALALICASLAVEKTDYFAYLLDFQSNWGMLDYPSGQIALAKLQGADLRYSGAPEQQVCSVFVDEPFINGVIAGNFANNVTNRVANNHCAPENFAQLFNSQIPAAAFEQKAAELKVPVEVWVRAGTDPAKLKGFDQPTTAVTLKEYGG